MSIDRFCELFGSSFNGSSFSICDKNYDSLSEEERFELNKIVNRWDALGFLGGIKDYDNNMRIILSISFEKFGSDVLCGSSKFSDGSNIVDIIFPILRYIITGLDKPRVISGDEIYELMEMFTIGDIIRYILNEGYIYDSGYMDNEDVDDIELGFGVYGYLEWLNVLLYRIKLSLNNNDMDLDYDFNKFELNGLWSYRFYMHEMDESLLGVSLLKLLTLMSDNIACSSSNLCKLFWPVRLDNIELRITDIECNLHSVLYNAISKLLNSVGNTSIDYEADLLKYFCNMCIKHLNGIDIYSYENEIKYDEDLCINIIKKIKEN